MIVDRGRAKRGDGAVIPSGTVAAGQLIKLYPDCPWQL